jgi:SAM-dependent methyltransferase
MTHGHGHGHGHAVDAVDQARLLSQEYWDERYDGEQVWSGNPNPLLVRYVADRTPGTALDVGSGEGADVLWLATHGWTVTGMDISEVALRRSAELVQRAAPELADRITWQQADVLTWTPGQARFDLVSAQFMHLAGPERESLHRRLAAAVRAGGTLLVVGHHPADMEIESLQRPNLPDRFATAEQMAVVLDPAEWDIETTALEREAKDPDGNTVRVRDAVLRGVRR